MEQFRDLPWPLELVDLGAPGYGSRPPAAWQGAQACVWGSHRSSGQLMGYPQRLFIGIVSGIDQRITSEVLQIYELLRSE